MIVGTDTAYENFYDFYALAPAHLEIRFNSLNFKKLPPLSLSSSARPRFLILFHRPRLSSHRNPSPILDQPRRTFRPSPENKIAPLCTVGDKVLGASRHADPPFALPHPSDNRHPRHPPWMLKHARVFSPFARSPIARPGLGIAADFEIILKKRPLKHRFALFKLELLLFFLRLLLFVLLTPRSLSRTCYALL